MRLFAGVMTGTSLDGIDVAVLQAGESATLGHVQSEIRLRGFFSRPIDHALMEALLELQQPADNELHRAALVANSLADAISRAVLEGLASMGLRSREVAAIGVHGQTIRHQPALGYSLQLNAPARIAEATGIRVVSDFRSRDIAAGGQGAPLVPAFHQAVFAHPDECRAIVNIGGIANITWLGEHVLGHDTGPGNMLMDAWVRRHQAKSFDDQGAWAASGQVHGPLLQSMLSDPFFTSPTPKSTGRDLFSESWLDGLLSRPEFQSLGCEDVQATLLALTSQSIAAEILRLEQQTAASGRGPCARLLICGGGARNVALINDLRQRIEKMLGRRLPIESTEALGWPAQAIEASAFAWLAGRTLDGLAGNCPEVTGALGPRVLGSITPA